MPSINKMPGLEAEPLNAPSRSSPGKNSPSRTQRKQKKQTKAKAQRPGGKAGAIPLLPIRNETQAQVYQERTRVKDIRAKVQAATVIQRAFRRWLFNPNRPAPAAVRARPRRYEGQVGIDVDTQNKQQQIAALTIQLAWRQYIGRQAERRARQTSLNQSLERQMQRERQQRAVYGSNVPLVQWKPTLAPTVRPLEFRTLPSPAVTSFSMALTTYAEPFVHIQRHRLQRAEEMLRTRQMDAERRLAKTEERMRHVLSSTAQRPLSALGPLEESELEFDPQDRGGSGETGRFGYRNHSTYDAYREASMQYQQQQRRARVDPHEIVRQFQANRGMVAT